MNNEKNVQEDDSPRSAEAIVIRAVAGNDELLEIGRKAIEDVLIEWRDSRLSQMPRGNGFVVREEDGSDSSIIRFGPETGVKIALKAIAKHLENGKHV